MTEQCWIPGYEGLYLISEFGAISHALTAREVEAHTDDGGYLRVTLCGHDGKRKKHRVHRLVCLAFHGAPPTPQHVAAHRNGLRLDVHRDNMRWATPAENSADMVEHGTVVRGSKHGSAKLNPAQVEEIRHLLAQPGRNKSEIARKFGVGYTTVHAIDKKRTWSWLEKLI